jgi:hypothetical protein
MVLNTVRLLDMSQQEIDDLFRRSEPGPIPGGEGAGVIVVAPGTRLSRIAARLVQLLFWQGKIFDPARGELRNRLSPFGLPTVVAKVYRGQSWFDSRDCIVLDYSKTSLVARCIRDEIRQIAPGIYLGVVFLGQLKTVNFLLRFGGRG